jgi:hypothetical protein
MMTYNNKISEISLSSPFSLMFGRSMNQMIDYTGATAQPVKLEDWKGMQEKIISLVYPAIELRAHKVRQSYIDKLQKTRGSLMNEELPPGASVMVKDPRWIKNPTARPKTEPLWIGPYLVVRRTLHGPYVLRSQDTKEEYERRVPVDQMKLLFRQPRVEKKDDKEVYVITKILDHRRQNHQDEYLVKWKGYDVPTWVPRSDINAPRLIHQFERLRSSRRAPKAGIVSILSSSPPFQDLLL